MTTTITPLLSRASDAVHRCLAEAPIGSHAILEAALAWQRLRPTGATSAAGAAAPRYLPLVETPSEDVAARVARLLSSLVWAIVIPIEDGHPARVEVPAVHYHRVLRALSGAWRRARRDFGPGSQPQAASAGAAVALWRMALLVAGPGQSRGMITLRVGTPAEADVLATASSRLGLNPTVEQRDGGLVVVLCDPDEVRRLLDEAGAAGPARVWLHDTHLAVASR